METNPSVFSHQRLFGPAPESPAALSHAEFLDRARQERERDDTDSSRAALGAFLVARLVVRWLELGGAPHDAEAYAWQWASTRRYLVELDQSLAETRLLQSVLDALDGERASQAPAARMALTAYAYFLEHEGRLAEGLEAVRLASRTYGETIPPADFTSLALFAGRLNRLQARWDEANAAYEAAEEAAVGVGDMVAVLRSRLGRVNVLRGQGNLPRARQVVEQVIAEAKADELTEVRSGAYADLACVYELQGDQLSALQANYEAVRLSRDPANQMRLVGDLGLRLAHLGFTSEARTAFETVIGSDASFLVRTNATLELMELESSVGNRMAFERCRQQVTGSVARMTPSMTVDYHYKVGLGFLRFGLRRRTRAVWEEGRRQAEQYRLNEWYFRLDKALENLDTPVTPTAAPEPAEAPDWLAQVSAGLREFADAGRE